MSAYSDTWGYCIQINWIKQTVCLSVCLSVCVPVLNEQIFLKLNKIFLWVVVHARTWLKVTLYIFIMLYNRHWCIDTLCSLCQSQGHSILYFCWKTFQFKQKNLTLNCWIFSRLLHCILCFIFSKFLFAFISLNRFEVFN